MDTGATGATVDMSDLKAKLDLLETRFAGSLMKKAAVAGLLLVMNRAKANVHKVSGTLARSIHIEAHSKQRTVDARVGSNLEYAAREEFLGGGSHAYMRPAWDAEKDNVKGEAAAALRDILRSVAS